MIWVFTNHQETNIMVKIKRCTVHSMEYQVIKSEKVLV